MNIMECEFFCGTNHCKILDDDCDVYEGMRASCGIRVANQKPKRKK